MTASESAMGGGQTVACPNCKGNGRVNDIRTASITHRATTIRRKCRYCRGSGEMAQPPTVPAEVASGDIPDWMLGWEDDEQATTEETHKR